MSKRRLDSLRHTFGGNLGTMAEKEAEFIGESIEPAREEMRVSDMVRGQPGVPMRFRWRDREYSVVEVVETWKTTGPCSHGSGEQYVRAHWYRIRTADGCEMTIYCDRQKRRGAAKREWRLYTMSNAPF